MTTLKTAQGVVGQQPANINKVIQSIETTQLMPEICFFHNYVMQVIVWQKFLTIYYDEIEHEI